MSNSNSKIVPPGTCPACLKRIDREKMNIARGFPCPHCHQFIRTSRMFRVCMNVVSIGGATAVSFLSDWPLFGKIIAWPICWALFTFLYIWMASIIRMPQLILSHKEEDREPFQGLGLR